MISAQDYLYESDPVSNTYGCVGLLTRTTYLFVLDFVLVHLVEGELSCFGKYLKITYLKLIVLHGFLIKSSPLHP